MNPEQPDFLDEQSEAWGPGSEVPVPFVPVYGPRALYGPVDDVMAVAEAVGVTPMDPVLLVDWHTRGQALTDDSLAQMLTAWSNAAAGVEVLDHARCAGDDCDLLLCLCPTGPCTGHVARECPHLELLCGDCRLAGCVECRQDARDDAGVSS